VQAAESANQLVAGAKVKMIGVAKNNLRAEFFQRFVAKGLHRSLCADGHEERSVDAAMRRIQDAATRATWIDF
jgi:hypothetical protein